MISKTSSKHLKSLRSKLQLHALIYGNNDYFLICTSNESNRIFFSADEMGCVEELYPSMWQTIHEWGSFLLCIVCGLRDWNWSLASLLE